MTKANIKEKDKWFHRKLTSVYLILDSSGIIFILTISSINVNDLKSITLLIHEFLRPLNMFSK